MLSKFIKHINKYYENSNLIDDIKVFIKLNNGIQLWNRNKYWYKNGLFHRGNDKPAIIRSDGIKKWFINGEFIKCNLNKNCIIYNDKFFDRNGNEIH
jgi:hypothetical protein